MVGEGGNPFSGGLQAQVVPLRWVGEQSRILCHFRWGLRHTTCHLPEWERLSGPASHQGVHVSDPRLCHRERSPGGQIPKQEKSDFHVTSLRIKAREDHQDKYKLSLFMPFGGFRTMSLMCEVHQNTRFSESFSH